MLASRKRAVSRGQFVALRRTQRSSMLFWCASGTLLIKALRSNFAHGEQLVGQRGDSWYGARDGFVLYQPRRITATACCRFNGSTQYTQYVAVGRYGCYIHDPPVIL